MTRCMARSTTPVPLCVGHYGDVVPIPVRMRPETQVLECPQDTGGDGLVLLSATSPETRDCLWGCLISRTVSWVTVALSVLVRCRLLAVFGGLRPSRPS